MKTFRPSRLWPAFALLPILVSACDGEDPIEPAQVADVEVTSPAEALGIGETAQLAVRVLDADGNELTDRAVTWQSSSDAVATVSATGLVTGVAAGAATITATAEGESGSVELAVTSILLGSVAPATLQPGQTATLTGEGFSASPGGNVVTIGGERVTVTAATATSLDVSIPNSVCLPTGNLDVVVRVGSQTSTAISHPFQSSAAPLQIPVGELTLFTAAADHCLRFGATAGNEAYVFGIQSTSQSAANLTPVQVGAVTPGSATTASLLTPLRRSSPAGRAPALQIDTRTRERWRRHRDAESRLRRDERRTYAEGLAASRALRRTPRDLVAAQAAAIDPEVGDTVNIRVPLLGNSCTQFVSIETVARVVGENSVWLEDVDNPAGGFTLDDLQSLSDRFDDGIYEVNTAWFGEPSDLDGNSKIAIVITREVNKQESVLGFVAAADLFPPETCPSSDFGEIYYARAVDEEGEFGEDGDYDEYTAEDARLDAVQLIPHEFTHIIQFGRRIEDPDATDFPSVWELEGQAVLGEEVNGHAATGRSGGQNFEFDVAFTGASGDAIPSEIAYYADGFIDIAIYFGLNIDGEGVTFRTENAPEQCSWLGRREQENNDGPCLPGREVYGTSWSFLRWATDQFAAVTPGGAQGFNRALIDDNQSGFATIQNVTGTPMNVLLSQWAATLGLDDRVPGMEARLTMPSWNYHDIFQATLDDQPLEIEPRERTFSTFTDDIAVRGGSSAYYTITGASRPDTYIRFRRENGQELSSGMQVWVVRTQ